MPETVYAQSVPSPPIGPCGFQVKNQDIIVWAAIDACGLSGLACSWREFVSACSLWFCSDGVLNDEIVAILLAVVCALITCFVWRRKKAQPRLARQGSIATFQARHQRMQNQPTVHNQAFQEAGNPR